MIRCGTGYLKYIATRERVEIIPDDRPPTQKQTQLIAKLVKDFPDAPRRPLDRNECIRLNFPCDRTRPSDLGDCT